MFELMSSSKPNPRPAKEGGSAAIPIFGAAMAGGPSDVAESQTAHREADGRERHIAHEGQTIPPYSGQSDRHRGQYGGLLNQHAQEMAAISIKLTEHQVERLEPDFPSEDYDADPVSSASQVDRHVALRIRQRRVMTGLSQKQLAHLFGVTYQQVHKYESGTNRISAGRLYVLSRALDVGVDWFFEGVTRQTNPEEQSPSRRMMLDFMRNVFVIEYDEHLQALSKMARALSETELV
jgi:transcriptional regulator with XRE-family HTH domain